MKDPAPDLAGHPTCISARSNWKLFFQPTRNLSVSYFLNTIETKKQDISDDGRLAFHNNIDGTKNKKKEKGVKRCSKRTTKETLATFPRRPYKEGEIETQLPPEQRINRCRQECGDMSRIYGLILLNKTHTHAERLPIWSEIVVTLSNAKQGIEN